jgi:DNA-binding response OmpR family regulator
VSKRSALGTLELDIRAGQLSNKGRIIRLAPQPFKLLTLLTAVPGRLVSRKEIRTALWEGDTFIDFEQSVNFTVKQVREALNDDAGRAI